MILTIFLSVIISNALTFSILEYIGRKQRKEYEKALKEQMESMGGSNLNSMLEQLNNSLEESLGELPPEIKVDKKQYH